MFVQADVSQAISDPVHLDCRYIWVDFNEYDGEWRAGRMSGQGTFVWKTGERYDGEWKVDAELIVLEHWCVAP